MKIQQVVDGKAEEIEVPDNYFDDFAYYDDETGEYVFGDGHRQPAD